MRAITATNAKNRFGEVLEMARTEDVHVQKNGRDVAIIISPEEHARLKASALKPSVNPLVERLHRESAARFGKVYEALAK